MFSVSGMNKEGIHSQTDTLRFVCFILISLVPILFVASIIFKNKFYSVDSFLKIKIEKPIYKIEKSLDYFSYILLAFLLYEFFSIDFTWFIGPIDIFHEGVQLTPLIISGCLMVL